jgi:oxaloacetate decarboxylase gamma subunit
MNMMSLVINRFFPEPQASADSSSAGAQKDNKKIVAAITAAIKYHRQG